MASTRTKPPTPGSLRRDKRIFIGGRWRGASRLDLAPSGTRSMQELVAAYVPGDFSTTLWGGEPTVRQDLPALLSALAAKGAARLGMRTDGHALSSAARVGTLRAAGLERVVFAVQSLRPSAESWLTGLQGGGRRLVSAMRLCREGGLAIEAEVVLTRPTLPFVSETVAGLARMGARRILLRRLVAEGPAAGDFYALSPRWRGLAAHLAPAVETAEGEGVEIAIEGFPLCVLPGLSAHVPPPGAVLWEGCSPPVQGAGCGHCTERCGGAGRDYLSRFGWSELLSALPRDPPKAALRLHVPPGEPTRSVRTRMVRLSGTGVQRLRITGDFSRSGIYSLLREALRLSIPSVELCGDLRHLDRLQLSERLRLRGISRIDGALLGPTPREHDAAIGEEGGFLRLLSAMEAVPVPSKGLYALISSPGQIQRYAESLRDGAFPWPLSFRLAGEGGSLTGLGKVLTSMEPPLREALEPLLPPCLGGSGATAPFPAETWKGMAEHEVFRQPYDIQGTFDLCRHRTACSLSSGCGGIPAGWSSEGLEPVEDG